MVRFTMPEFSTKPNFEFEFHLDDREVDENDKYDMILGTAFKNKEICNERRQIWTP